MVAAVAAVVAVQQRRLLVAAVRQPQPEVVDAAALVLQQPVPHRRQALLQLQPARQQLVRPLPRRVPRPQAPALLLRQRVRVGPIRRQRCCGQQ